MIEDSDSGSGTPRPPQAPSRSSVGPNPSTTYQGLSSLPLSLLPSVSIRSFWFKRGAFFYMSYSPTISQHENRLRSIPCARPSSSPLSLRQGNGERSVVHEANECQSRPFLGNESYSISNPIVGARRRMFISADLFSLPSPSFPLSSLSFSDESIQYFSMISAYRPRVHHHYSLVAAS